jgi:hypothetical protein
MTEAFFNRREGRFVGNSAARGPWDPGACHAGPVAGVLAGELEALAEGRQLVRLTVDVPRPVPIAGFRVEGTVVRASRSVTATAATLLDDQGRVCATATGLHVLPGDLGDVPTTAVEAPRFEEAADGPFFLRGRPSGLPGFGSAVTIRYPPGETNDPGPTTVWMWAPMIVQGEVSSPFQRICPLADCGNALSRNADLPEYTFANADLTVYLVRPPTGEWFASRSVGHWESSGIGLSDSALFDARGLVGRALQTIVLRRGLG